MTLPIPAGCPAMLRRTGLIAAALALLLLPGVPAKAQDADPVVAKVNGVEIRQSDLAAIEAEAGQIPPMLPDQKKDYLVTFMTDLLVVSQAAEAKKLGDTPAFKRKLDFARKKLLMSELLDDTGEKAVTDAEMRKVYDEAVKSIPEEKEVHARHILIRAAPGDEKATKEAEDKIKAIIARLNKGEDFEKLAKELTEDPSGKANGGDLGYFTKAQMVPEFANVAFSLEKGKISEPVKTQFGWHVIKVVDSRIKPAPTFDEVKPQIEQFVVRKAQADLVTKLRAEAKVEKFYKVEGEDKADDKKPADEKK